MYQVKATCGYEIQVIGSGNSGLCRVVDGGYVVQYSGTYDECVRWLKSRAVKVLS